MLQCMFTRKFQPTAIINILITSADGLQPHTTYELTVSRFKFYGFILNIMTSTVAHPKGYFHQI